MTARRFILIAAIATVTLGVLLVATPSSWIGKGGVLERWQTLIAAIVALGAAWVAARPVWRQLADMRLQTNTGLRDFLMDRLARMERRRQTLLGPQKKASNDIAQRFYEMAEFEGGQVNPEWAFAQEGTMRDIVASLTAYLGTNREPPDLEAALSDARQAAEALETKLGLVHRTTSHSQFDEDYSFTDEEWAAMESEDEAAAASLGDEIAAFSSALNALDEAFASELALSRERLLKVEAALLAST